VLYGFRETFQRKYVHASNKESGNFFEYTEKLRKLYFFSYQSSLDPEHLQVFWSGPANKMVRIRSQTDGQKFGMRENASFCYFYSYICLLSPHRQGLVQVGGPGSCCTPPGPESTGLSSPAPLRTPEILLCSPNAKYNDFILLHEEINESLINAIAVFV
jgi:hypothetical protein